MTILTAMFQLATAYVGSLCFSMMFRVPREKLLAASLGGLLAWGLYLLLGLWIPDDTIRYFLVSLVITLYAEAMARRKKSPTTLFLMSAAIPLIPGGALYATMAYAVRQQWSDFSRQGIDTLLLAAAIACGILCMMTVLQGVEMVLRRGRPPRQ